MLQSVKKLFSKKINILIFLHGYRFDRFLFHLFQNYDYPPSVFWDENYHIASAEKYLTGVMFMEAHPPLGKLFVALGEYIIHPNDSINKSDFTQTDYIKDFPAGYSFAGVRFFSALFAWLSAIVFSTSFISFPKIPTLPLFFLPYIFLKTP